jgi:hypothetical protein
MQYLQAETLCQQALQMAYERKLWSYFARITLPLQECRRQRRMIAAEGHIVLGTDHLPNDALQTLDALPAGCVVFTGKDAQTHAAQLLQGVQKNPRHLLVLAAETGEDQWTVHSASQPDVSVNYPAPPSEWQHTTMPPQAWPELKPPCNWPTPGDWFLDALEKLGDQALKTAQSSDDNVLRVDELLSAMYAVTDHEILHQQLAQAATALIY